MTGDEFEHDLIETARYIEDSRPIPAPGFRGELRRAIDDGSLRESLKRGSLRVSFGLGSAGTGCFALVMLGVAGIGPFAG